MAFTSKLGAADATLANILLGTFTGVITYPAADNITFTDSATGVNTTSHAADTITFTESASETKVRHPVAADTITFTETARSLIPFNVSSADTISFTELARGRGRYLAADTITFSDSATKSKVQGPAASDTLVLADKAQASFLHISAASDTITFTDSAVRIRYTALSSDTLTFTDAATATPSRKQTASDTLTFTESPTNLRVYSRTATDTINFQETKFDPSEGVFLGAVIGLKVINSFVLKGAAGTITLPRPDFSDSENTTNEFNLRTSRTNISYTTLHRRRLNRRLVFVFNVSRRKERELVEFLSILNDKYLDLFNWKGEQWKVKLLTNPIQSNNIGFDRFRVELEFEGIKITSGGVSACQC